MIVVVKFKKKGEEVGDKFLGILGVFSSWEQAQIAANTELVTFETPEGATEAVRTAKPLSAHLGCGLVGFEVPTLDDFASVSVGGMVASTQNLAG